MNTALLNTEQLRLDPKTGVIFDAPPRAALTRKQAEEHPFIAVQRDHILVGPDARRVARGGSGSEYAVYQIRGEVAGALRLERSH